MVLSIMTAARIAVSPATMVITNPAVAAYLTLVQTTQRNAQEEYHRLVPAAYGLEVQNALLIRFAAVEAVQRVHLVSMFIRILAKTIATAIAARMVRRAVHHRIAIRHPVNVKQ